MSNLVNIDNICKSGDVNALNTYVVEKISKSKLEGIIQSAAKYDNVAIIDAIVKFGISVNQRGLCEETALMVACKHGNINVVKYLLYHDANCDFRDSDHYQGYHGKTALIYATENDNYEIVKILLEYKCDVNIIDANNMRAIDYADSVDVIELLIKNGAIVNPETPTVFTPVFSMACANGEIDIIDCLLSHDIDVNFDGDLCHDKTTPLMYACKYEQVDAVDRLLNHKDIKIHMKDNLGWTAFMHAVQTGNLSIIDRLIIYGANINDYDEKGNTPLMIAVKENKYHVIERLLSLNCDINIKNNSGETALTFACKTGDIKTINIILSNGGDPSIPDNK